MAFNIFIGIKRCALLPGDSLSVATTSPNHLSQGKSLIFQVCGCSPRLLNGIDRFHKVMIIFVEPTGIPANKNKIALGTLFTDVTRPHLNKHSYTHIL